MVTNYSFPPYSPWVVTKATENDPPVDCEQYQQLVGKFIYLSLTRPNIVFSVSVIYQFMHSPTKQHLKATNRVLKYLQGIPSKGILFKKSKNRAM